jgi:hypothetical protein
VAKWYRVFCASEATPADTCGCLAGAVHHYRADEEGIRAELNSWAAYVETFEQAPRHRELMERVIQSKQLFYFEEPSPSAREACVRLSRHLARLAGGFYHVEDEGFFDADGTLLIAEPGG